MVLVAQLEQDKAEEQQVERSRDLHVEVWKERQKHKQPPHCTTQDVITDRQAKRGPKSCYLTNLLKALTELFDKQWA